jgi:hypothetical protein
MWVGHLCGFRGCLIPISGVILRQAYRDTDHGLGAQARLATGSSRTTASAPISAAATADTHR